MGYHAHPDMIIREDEMVVYLQALAIQTGYSSTTKITAELSDAPLTLEEVYDEKEKPLSKKPMPWIMQPSALAA